MPELSRFSWLLGMGVLLLTPVSALAKVYKSAHAHASHGAAPRPVVTGCDSPAHAWPEVLTVKSGLQSLLHLPGVVTRVSVGDPDTADVTLVDTRNLLVLGKKAGETNLLLWTKCSSLPVAIVVNVPKALSSAQEVSKPESPEALKSLPSQVQIELRFVELSRSRLRSIGVDMQGNSNNGNTTRSFGTPNASATGTGNGGVSSGYSLAGASGAYNFALGKAGFGIALNLLESTGYAYEIANPTLVAMSGQLTTFLAGGEVPIPVPQSSGTTGSSPAITVEYKEFGVRVAVTPTVLSSSQIVLKLSPEVSDLDYTDAITLYGSTIPALKVRRTETTVTLGDGESFIISGLVTRTMNETANKMPWLGDIPILGAFFRNKSLDQTDKELVMIVTPHLVRPLAAGAKLPELPGQAMDHYDPTTSQLLFMNERSPYKSETPIGLSR